MKTAYRLHCASIDEVDQVYIGVIEFKTFDAAEMVQYIKDLDEEDADDLYTVEEYPADDNGTSKGKGKYYTPSQFVRENSL